MNQALGWRGSFLVLALFNLGYVLAFLISIRERPFGASTAPAIKSGSFKELFRVFRIPAYWIISLATFFRYGCFIALQGLWAGPFLIGAVGLSPLQTGNALLLMGIGYMVGLPLSGRVSDHWIGSRKKVIYPSLWMSALLMFSLFFWPHRLNFWWVYLVFLCLGLCSAPGQVMYPHIKELVPPRATGTALSGINFFTMLGAALITEFIGVLAGDRAVVPGNPEAFQTAWLFCSAGLALAGTLYLLVPDSRVLNHEKQALYPAV
jgi:predicted MFS family arabinose efflux permease